MIDYVPNMDTLYTIVIKESGECRQMTHKDLKVKSNITMGIRGSYSKPPLNGNYNSVKQMDGITLNSTDKS